MKVDVLNLKSYSCMELYDILLPIIDSVCSKYDYIMIKESSLKKIVSSSIKKFVDKFDSLKSEDFEVCFEEYLNDYMKKYVLKLFLKLDDDTLINIISNFVNENVGKINSYSEALIGLEKLSSFFGNVHFLPLPDLFLKLLNNNVVISKIFELIVNNNFEDIKNNKTSKLFDNNMSVSLIETYCITNNIEILMNNNFNGNFDPYENVDNLDGIEPMRLYYQEINRPLLSCYEERKLIYDMLNGDVNAEKTLIERNLRLVFKIAKVFTYRGIDFDDLVQQGSLGLIEAVRKFDPRMYYRLSTYATYCIIGSITRYISYNSSVLRIPENKFYKLNYFMEKKLLLEDSLGRVPTVLEMSEELNMPVGLASDLYNLQNDVVSMNEIINDDINGELGDLVIDNDMPIETWYELEALSGDIKKLFENSRLKANEISVLVLKFGLDGKGERTFEQISSMLGLTYQRIQQIKDKAILKLRNSSSIDNFAIYMDDPDMVISNMKAISGYLDLDILGKDCYEQEYQDIKKKLDSIIDSCCLNEIEKEMLKLRCELSDGKETSIVDIEKTLGISYGKLLHDMKLIMQKIEKSPFRKDFNSCYNELILVSRKLKAIDSIENGECLNSRKLKK